jgi:predicted nucleotidyltransferase
MTVASPHTVPLTATAYGKRHQKAKRPAMMVPPINVRERIPQEAILDVVDQIAAQFQPKEIILFGSYAYGHPHQTSDVDLLVVMDTPLRETALAVRICQALECNFGVDLIVRTPAKLTQRLAWGDFFLLEIINKGKVLYESTDRRMDR